MTNATHPVRRKVTNQLRKVKKACLMADYRPEYYKQVKRLTVTLSLDQGKKLAKFAKAYGFSSGKRRRDSAFLRELAFAYLDQRYLVPSNLDEKLDKLIFILRNYGNQINQLTKHINKTKKASIWNVLKILNSLRKAEQAIIDHVRNPPKA